MKIVIPKTRRRNPLVAATMFRRAGTHRQSGASQRQQHGRALRRELESMKHIP